jgi:DNA-binding SARP family transcriptional activator
MDFQVLGPVEVSADGVRVRLGGPRQQALLAYLLLHQSEPVSAERLVEELWHEPPANGTATVQTLVSRLRAALGGRVERVGKGYALSVGADELDLDRFRALLADAGSSVDAADRARLLREADGLWKGRPLDGLDVPFADAEVRALDELRLGAVEERIDAELELRRHAALVPELVALVARQPLRERLRGQLILALYRAGRQAEALDAYRETRRLLDEELGLEPSESLKALEGAILRHDPELDSRVASTVVAGTVEVPPRGRRNLPVLVALLGAAAALGVAGFAIARDASRPSAAPTVAAESRPVTLARSVTVVRIERPSVAKRVVRTVSEQRTVHEITTVASPSVATGTVPELTTTVRQSKPATLAKRVVPATPVVRTHTHPTATTTTNPKPASPATGAAHAVTISDSFGGIQINPRIWTEVRTGAGWDMSEHGGSLEFVFPPTSAGVADQYFGGHVGTRCSFPGDFDARVDYDLVTWPPGNQVFVTLFSFLGPQSTYFQSSRTSQTAGAGGENYVSYTGWWTTIPIGDRSGTLRVVRTNGLVTTYFLNDGRWQAMTSARDTERATIGVGALGSSTAAFAGQTVTVDFSSFSVTGTNPACPAGGN